MIQKILKWPDPILLQPCQPWDFNNPPVLPDIEPDLVDTMMSQQALGLAANQIGIPYGVMAMNIQTGDLAGQQVVMFNPQFAVDRSDTWEHEEGCLSFPGVFLKIARYKTVRANWYDQTGTPHQATFTELDSKCFLHELDHLSGQVFKKYVSDLKYMMAVKKAKK